MKKKNEPITIEQAIQRSTNAIANVIDLPCELYIVAAGYSTSKGIQLSFTQYGSPLGLYQMLISNSYAKMEERALRTFLSTSEKAASRAKNKEEKVAIEKQFEAMLQNICQHNPRIAEIFKEDNPNELCDS